MNYTHYILNKQPLQPELMISDKPYLKELTTAIVLPVSIIGFFFVALLIPAAMLIDLTRLMKLKRYQWQAEKRKRKYISCVLRSLDREVDKYTVQLLMAA